MDTKAEQKDGFSEAQTSKNAGEKRGLLDPVALGEKLFRLRDYTPIPLIILMWFVASPTKVSATIGTMIIICGEVLRIYSVSFIGSISRTRSDNLGSRLVTSGPFRYVRNPLYVGNFLITFGFAFYSAEPVFVALATALFAFQYFNIVRYEETLLRVRFGEDFDRYCQEVPAWFPSRLPALDEIEWPLELAGAIRSEKRTFLALGAVFVLLFLSGR